MNSTRIEVEVAVQSGPFKTNESESWIPSVDRRDHRRISRSFSALLLALGSNKAIACTTDDLAVGGLYLLAPADSGLSVGQRFEVGLIDSTQPTRQPSCLGEGCYATVVRTEPISRESKFFIGAGLRFDNSITID